MGSVKVNFVSYRYTYRAQEAPHTNIGAFIRSVTVILFTVGTTSSVEWKGGNARLLPSNMHKISSSSVMFFLISVMSYNLKLVLHESLLSDLSNDIYHIV